MSDATQPRTPRGRLLGPAIALALLALLALAPFASAAYDPVAGGTTKLSLDKGFLTLLKKNGVKLLGKESAKLKGTTVTFPAIGGKLDPTTSKGFVEHEGALVFQAGKNSIPIKALQLKTTQKHSPFSVKVGGGQLKLASAAKISTAREGFGLKIKTTTLKLSAKVAERLDKKLRMRGVFAQGQTIGSTVTKVRPATVTVQGTGRTSLTPNPETIARLNELFVAVNPIFPAEHLGSAFTFSIFGGTIAIDASTGTLETNGSLELIQLMGGQVFLHEPWVDLATKTLSAEVDVEPVPTFAGKLGRVAIADLSLAGAAISSNPGARTVTVDNAAATMQAGLAETLNEVFAKPKGKGNFFKAGEPLGIISFTAQSQ
jgi:hypothetical protein